MDIDIQALFNEYSPVVLDFGVQLAMAIIVFLVGKWIARKVTSLLNRSMGKSGIDATVCTFASNLVYALLMTVVIIATLAQVGIQTASFVAIIGAAGLAVGLALQGSLANFAAGVLMILFRPLKQGDFVEAAGVSGVVADISIFCTTFTSGDNKTIIVPNSSIMSGAITNYSTMPTRRIDMVIGISYDASMKQAKQIISDILAADDRVLNDPVPTVAVAELADSSVNLVVRPWVNSADYWPTRFALHEEIKERFDAADIGIPYPQMDVHVSKDN